MPIYEESRYETAPVVPVAASDGVFRATIQPPLGAPDIGDYSVHRVEFGETMDVIAFQAYGDTEFWWRIADANPELDYPDAVEPGMLLRIPALAVEF